MIPDVVRYRQADLLSGLHRRFGPVVRVGPYTYLLGPEANQFVFGNSELFEVEQAFQSLVPVDGPTSLIVSDGEDHKRRRRFVQPALAHRQIASYVPVMRANAEATIDAWRPGETVDAYQECRRAIRRSTIHALFGEELAQDSDFFGAHLQVLINLIDRNPAVVKVLRTMKAPAWRNAMRARRAVDARVYKAIEETRQGKTAGDVLTSLVQGDGLSDLEVRDQIVTLIAAGYETTSGAMAWAVFNLLRHNGVWERAQQDDDYLANVVNETLRLYPCGSRLGAGRRAVVRVRREEDQAGHVPAVQPIRHAPAGRGVPGPAEVRPGPLGDQACAARVPAVRRRPAPLRRCRARHDRTDRDAESFAATAETRTAPPAPHADRPRRDAPQERPQNPSSRMTIEARQANARRWFQIVHVRRYSGQ